jgi:tRNA dimethylallyltransferase
MKDHKPTLIVIAGPTASGKSTIAVELASEFNGEIINADSMQVYRYMDIGTAKLAMSERRGIIHHMIDVADPNDAFNASRYREEAMPVIKEINERRKTCFVVGGTGLYIKTLLGGLMECPPSDPRLRDELMSECKEKGVPFLHERLRKLDPESAGRIHPNDRTRVVRALEIISLTDRAHSSIIMEHGFSDRPFHTLKICLNMERTRLYKRIDERSERMVEAGLIDETSSLIEMGYAPVLKSMNSLGYRHAVAFIKNECSLETMLYRLKQDTRRYAKRQLTWFRADHEMIAATPDKPDFIKLKIEEFLN